MIFLLNRYIDEIQAVYKFYKKCLKENKPQALAFYGAVIMGCFLYLFILKMWHDIEIGGYFIFTYQAILCLIGYSHFRNMYLDEHSPTPKK